MQVLKPFDESKWIDNFIKSWTIDQVDSLAEKLSGTNKMSYARLLKIIVSIDWLFDVTE